MTNTYDKNHLVFRNGIWHYRRRIPKDASHLDNRKYIKKSLKTDSKENVRNKALQNFINLISDKLIENITRQDAVSFRE